MTSPTSEHTIPIKSSGCGCSGSCSTTLPLSEVPVAASQAGATVLLIPAMDCPSEENDIRRALVGIGGIRSLSFQLSARTLSIDAPD
jgi:Cd2+/Zn2+-exporting ATPase